MPAASSVFNFNQGENHHLIFKTLSGRLSWHSVSYCWGSLLVFPPEPKKLTYWMIYRCIYSSVVLGLYFVKCIFKFTEVLSQWSTSPLGCSQHFPAGSLQSWDILPLFGEWVLATWRHSCEFIWCVKAVALQILLMLLSSNLFLFLKK